MLITGTLEIFWTWKNMAEGLKVEQEIEQMKERERDSACSTNDYVVPERMHWEQMQKWPLVLDRSSPPYTHRLLLEMLVWVDYKRSANGAVTNQHMWAQHSQGQPCHDTHQPERQLELNNNCKPSYHKGSTNSECISSAAVIVWSDCEVLSTLTNFHLLICCGPV